MKDKMSPGLLAAAQQAMAKAYAPYSKFHVGASLVAANGRIYSGCNVENSAYPQGNCAEVSAIAHMVMDGQTQIVEVAVVGPGTELVMPCGGCRQCIREFARGDTPVHICGPEGLRETFTLDRLLPSPFGAQNLENSTSLR